MNLEESYNEYKKILSKIYKDNEKECKIKMMETPTSFLTYIKYGLKDFLREFPEANNEPFEVPQSKIPYINRIAGFIDLETGTFETKGHQFLHQDIVQHYDNNMARFFVYDGYYGRAVYISFPSEEGVIKAYKLLRKTFNKHGADCYILDVSDGTDYDNFIKTIVYDSKGKKYDENILTDINNIPWLRKYINEWFNKMNIYNNEINEILKLSNVKQLNENWDEYDDFYDIYEECEPFNILMWFRNEPEKNIWFPLIKPTEYKQALTEFMKYGEIVRYPEDKIKSWLYIIFRNTAILNSMTELAGGTSFFPFDACRDAIPELDELENNDFHEFSEALYKLGYYDWAKLPDGSDAMSDYGITPIMKIINEYNDSMTASEILVLVNRCLDVWHHRGDLASAFIEGGSSSLTKISNECVDKKGNKLFENYNQQSFSIPSLIPQDNFKITNSLKDIEKWRAKIVENNSSSDESLGIGDFDEVGYVMISLKDNTIIPIARADEHRTGYEVLRDVYGDEYGIPASDYISVFCIPSTTNYPYDEEQANELKQALIKCKSYGMDLNNSYVYMKYFYPSFKNKDWNNASITAEDFVNGDYEKAELNTNNITDLGKELFNAFQSLHNNFKEENVKGKFYIQPIKKSLNVLYKLCSKLNLMDENDYDEILLYLDEYKQGYINNQKLQNALFGYMGFQNNIHNKLRNNINNKELNKKLGNVKDLVDMIGNL